MTTTQQSSVSSVLDALLAKIDQVSKLPAKDVRYDEKPIARPANWPTIHEHAYYGPIGEAVKNVAPFTEADPAAVLASLLAYAGALIGNGTSLTLSGEKVVANLFVVIVGPTALGRKGTSLNLTQKLLGDVPDLREIRGLGSGEALVADLASVDESSKHTVIIEEEFARLLESAGRSGSTLSQMIRQLYDGKDLGRRTAEARQVATDYHTALIGHITPDELRLLLSASDQTNGLANRFLMVASHTSRIVVWDDQGDPNHLCRKAVEAAGIASIARLGRNRGPMSIDDGAYHALVYLSHGEHLRTESDLLMRLWSHLLRVTLIYAVMDGGTVVRIEHVKAALAFVLYAMESTLTIFSQQEMSSTTSKILNLIEKSGVNGLTRTQLTAQLSNHVKSDQRDAAISELAASGLIAITTRSSGGRPAEIYVSVRHSSPEAENADTHS
jgi:hypothetical protein